MQGKVQVKKIISLLSLGVLSLAIFTSCAELTFILEKNNFDKVELGSSRKSVIKIMGEPNSSYTKWPEERLLYGGTVIIIENKKVVHKVILSTSKKIRIEIESFNGTPPKARIAQILPSMKGISPRDLKFIAVKNIVKKALKEKGYRVSENSKEVDTIIFINYSISGPKTKTKTWTEPVYDYVMSNSQPQPEKTSHQIYNQYGQTLGTVESKTTYGNPYAIDVPQPIYRGERTHHKTSTSYIRSLVMEAVDYKYFKLKNELNYFWKVSLTSKGTGNDLMELMPYFAMTSENFIEKNSQGKQRRIVYIGDPRGLRLLEGQSFMNNTNRRQYYENFYSIFTDFCPKWMFT